MADIESASLYVPSGQDLGTQAGDHAGQKRNSAEPNQGYSHDTDLNVEATTFGSTNRMDIDPPSQPDSGLNQVNQLSHSPDLQLVASNVPAQAETLVDRLTALDSLKQEVNDEPQTPSNLVAPAEESEAPEAAHALEMSARTDSLAVDSVSSENPAVATPPRGSRKRKNGEASVTPVRKRYRAKGPTKLRKGKKIDSEVPMDVWSMIFSYCPAKFLAKARRISKAFNHILQYESVWKENRLQNYGPDLPEPFPGMREDEYANLLEGLGCMDCRTPKTRKTYWLWRKRWCSNCYEKNTIKV